jgi:hypothetical protein
MGWPGSYCGALYAILDSGVGLQLLGQCTPNSGATKMRMEHGLLSAFRSL